MCGAWEFFRCDLVTHRWRQKRKTRYIPPDAGLFCFSVSSPLLSLVVWAGCLGLVGCAHDGLVSHTYTRTLMEWDDTLDALAVRLFVAVGTWVARWTTGCSGKEMFAGSSFLLCFS